jgi:hypothetical protein
LRCLALDRRKDHGAHLAAFQQAKLNGVLDPVAVQQPHEVIDTADRLSIQ